jgi:hypothetical protein
LAVDGDNQSNLPSAPNRSRHRPAAGCGTAREI